MRQAYFSKLTFLVLSIFLLAACQSAISEPTSDSLANQVGRTEVADVTPLPAATELPTLTPVTVVPTDIPATSTKPAATSTSVAQPTNTSVPSLTPTSTATVTPGPSATPWPTPPPTWTATPEPLNTPRPIPTPHQAQPIASGEFCVVGVELDDMLMIRAEADHTSEILGGIPPFGQNVPINDEALSRADGNWVEIDYYGRVGWVNSTFLGRQYGVVDEAVSTAAIEVLLALRTGDTATLSNWVHPEKGLTIAPGSYISEENPVFSAENVANLWTDTTSYTWGYDSGTGEAIDLPFREFYDSYLYVQDFFFADAVAYDENVASGNLVDNARELFPDAHTVEYHFDGFDPQFGGLDYIALRIVLEPVGDQQYVVALALSQWAP